MEDCLFCKIIKKEIPADIVYEDEDTLAFLDINPINKGHTLVIPKQHHKNIFEITPEAFQRVMETVRKISPAVKKAANAPGISINISNEKEAGQMIFHLHVHVIPRRENDSMKWPPTKKYEGNESKELLSKIKSFL